MVQWLEQERSVDYIVSVKYTNDSLAQGVAFTRKLCPVSTSPLQILPVREAHLE